MTDMFRAAVKQLLELGLRCPKCLAVNIEGRSPTISLEPYEQASCAQCGHGGPLAKFQEPTNRGERTHAD